MWSATDTPGAVNVLSRNRISSSLHYTGRRRPIASNIQTGRTPMPEKPASREIYTLEPAVYLTFMRRAELAAPTSCEKGFPDLECKRLAVWMVRGICSQDAERYIILIKQVNHFPCGTWGSSGQATAPNVLRSWIWWVARPLYV